MTDGPLTSAIWYLGRSFSGSNDPRRPQIRPPRPRPLRRGLRPAGARPVRPHRPALGSRGSRYSGSGRGPHRGPARQRRGEAPLWHHAARARRSVGSASISASPPTPATRSRTRQQQPATRIPRVPLRRMCFSRSPRSGKKTKIRPSQTRAMVARKSSMVSPQPSPEPEP